MQEYPSGELHSVLSVTVANQKQYYECAAKEKGLIAEARICLDLDK